MLIKHLEPGDRDRLEEFLLDLPRQDGGFLKTDVRDSVDLAALVGQSRGAGLIAVEDDDSISGYATVLPSVGRSSHVAELRLVVAPGARRHGIGRELARAALLQSVRLGLEKLVVEVLAQQDDVVEMFLGLGFEAEALLQDFVRDEDGEYADLMVLVHPSTAAADLAAVGIREDLR
jgi:ribosomal protein S18 acetylase RimI-like enzyme